jgi:hypothetical protein
MVAVMENAEKKIRNFQRTISLSNIKGIKVLSSTKGNRFKNPENIGRLTIFIPSDIVTFNEIIMCLLT